LEHQHLNEANSKRLLPPDDATSISSKQFATFEAFTLPSGNERERLLNL
jgi:hypothetical protein